MDYIDSVRRLWYIRKHRLYRRHGLRLRWRMHRFIHPWRHVALAGGMVAMIGVAVLGGAAIGVQSASIQVDPSSEAVEQPPTRVKPIVNPTDLRRLAFADLVYDGAFRLPSTNSNGDGFGFGGQAAAYNPVSNSLFISTRSGRVAEVTVPDAVKAATIGGLPVAEYLQPFADPAEGRLQDIGKVGSRCMAAGPHRQTGRHRVIFTTPATQTLSHLAGRWRWGRAVRVSARWDRGRRFVGG